MSDVDWLILFNATHHCACRCGPCSQRSSGSRGGCMASAQLGTRRERQVCSELRKEGWVTFRTGGTGGDDRVVDVVAMRFSYPTGHTPLDRLAEVRFIEVKASGVKRGRYADFGPADRRRLSEAAAQAGATAWLAWWPSRGELHMIPESEWPT